MDGCAGKAHSLIGKGTRAAGKTARAGKAKGSLKSRGLLCNCPAPGELYGKMFPHAPGKVRGCHMGSDGQAKHGVARPGCACKACDVTNTQRESEGYGSQFDRLEGFTTSVRDYRHWETDFADWQNAMAGVSS